MIPVSVKYHSAISQLIEPVFRFKVESQINSFFPGKGVQCTTLTSIFILVMRESIKGTSMNRQHSLFHHYMFTRCSLTELHVLVFLWLLSYRRTSLVIVGIM